MFTFYITFEFSKILIIDNLWAKIYQNWCVCPNMVIQPIFIKLYIFIQETSSSKKSTLKHGFEHVKVI